MARFGLGCLWVPIVVLALHATAACTSYGVDYSNGGSYYIDAASNQYFSFITVFQGTSKTEPSAKPRRGTDAWDVADLNGRRVHPGDHQSCPGRA
jgi:hypothetical protein